MKITRWSCCIGIAYWMQLTCLHAQVNSWTNSNGLWQDGVEWSLGVAPTGTQSHIYITNAISKGVAIDINTSTSFPGTLTISNLDISAPGGATNDLVMAAATLHIRNNFTIFTGGALDLASGGRVEVGNDFDVLAGDVTIAFAGTLRATNNASATSVGGSAGPARINMLGNSGLLHVNALALGPSNPGTLTINLGSVLLQGPTATFIGGNHTGTVWMTGAIGTLVSTNPGNRILIGGNGVGLMVVSNGTADLAVLGVGPSGVPGNRGTLTIAGGLTTVSSNMTIGSYDCGTTGIVEITAGSLFVTNAAHKAVLEVRSGTLTVSGGSLVVDNLILTNACAHIFHTGGTLKVNNATIFFINGDVDGDGVPNDYEYINGMDLFNPADAALDFDGDGLSNLQEYFAGTNPRNAASALRITSIVRTNNNLRITWTTAAGKTNALERATGTANGSYSTNNFTDIFTVTNTVGSTTNYLDLGAASGFSTSRFYRVRLVP